MIVRLAFLWANIMIQKSNNKISNFTLPLSCIRFIPYSLKGKDTSSIL